MRDSRQKLHASILISRLQPAVASTITLILPEPEPLTHLGQTLFASLKASAALQGWLGDGPKQPWRILGLAPDCPPDITKTHGL